MTAPDNELTDRSTGELLKQLSNETTTLVRHEIDLMKAELAQKAKPAGIGAGMFGGAGLFGLGAFLALTAFFIALRDGAMPIWAAALIVAAVYALIAGALALTGKQKVREATPVAPEQTMESVKEDVQWAKTRARSGMT
jgi:Putative Actinobacterial Holin-X, holin superfamily III